MFGFSTLRETWNTQWGPAPVLALHEPATDTRSVAITLPFGGDPFGRSTAAHRSRTRTGSRRAA